MEKNTLKEFYIEIYGEEIFKRLVDFDDRGIYRLKPKEKIEEVFFDSFIGIDQKFSNSCDHCKSKYNELKPHKKTFDCRNMDFPGWLGEINENDECKKEIMILGESVTDKLELLSKGPCRCMPHLNINWHLGYKITNIKDIEAKKNNKSSLWAKFDQFFGNLSQNVVEKFYISDMAFCSCDKKKDLYLECAETHLRRHLDLINPKMLITLGNSANLAFFKVKKLLEREFIPIKFNMTVGENQTYYKMDDKLVDEKFKEKPEKNKVGILKRQTQGVNILYINIPHISGSNCRWNWVEMKGIWQIILENAPPEFSNEIEELFQSMGLLSKKD